MSFKENSKKLSFESKGVFLIACTLLILGGYYLGVNFYVINNYEETNGVVVAFEKEGSSIKLPVIKFHLKEGKVVNGKGFNRTSNKLWEEVMIYHNSIGSKVFVKDFRSQYVDGTLLILGGIVTVFIAYKISKKQAIQ